MTACNATPGEPHARSTPQRRPMLAATRAGIATAPPLLLDLPSPSHTTPATLSAHLARSFCPPPQGCHHCNADRCEPCIRASAWPLARKKRVRRTLQLSPPAHTAHDGIATRPPHRLHRNSDTVSAPRLRIASCSIADKDTSAPRFRHTPSPSLAPSHLLHLLQTSFTSGSRHHHTATTPHHFLNALL